MAKLTRRSILQPVHSRAQAQGRPVPENEPRARL